MWRSGQSRTERVTHLPDSNHKGLSRFNCCSLSKSQPQSLNPRTTSAAGRDKLRELDRLQVSGTVVTIEKGWEIALHFECVQHIFLVAIKPSWCLAVFGTNDHGGILQFLVQMITSKSPLRHHLIVGNPRISTETSTIVKQLELF